MHTNKIGINDTRIHVKGNFSVKDAYTKVTLLSKSFSIPANGKSVEDNLPETDKTKL